MYGEDCFIELQSIASYIDSDSARLAMTKLSIYVLVHNLSSVEILIWRVITTLCNYSPIKFFLGKLIQISQNHSTSFSLQCHLHDFYADLAAISTPVLGRRWGLPMQFEFSSLSFRSCHFGTSLVFRGSQRPPCNAIFITL
jgi:hypothetical protein